MAFLFIKQKLFPTKEYQKLPSKSTDSLESHMQQSTNQLPQQANLSSRPMTKQQSVVTLSGTSNLKAAVHTAPLLALSAMTNPQPAPAARDLASTPV